MSVEPVAEIADRVEEGGPRATLCQSLGPTQGDENAADVPNVEHLVLDLLAGEGGANAANMGRAGRLAGLLIGRGGPYSCRDGVPLRLPCISLCMVSAL